MKENHPRSALPTRHWQFANSYSVEYLNSGIAFSWSLVASNTAWSGYQGFGLTAGAAGAAPGVTPPDGGRVLLISLEPLFAAVAVLMGSLTNLTLSSGTATRCEPTPKNPPTLITVALMLPLLSISRSLIEPRLSSLAL